MKITYTFANGETSLIEVTDDWGAIVLDLDRQEKNLNRKETRRHTSIDSYEYIDDQADSNPRLSRDAFEYRNHICADSAEIAADLENKYTHQHIRETVAKLKPTQRDLITAIYFDGGDRRRLTVIVPGDSVESLSINEVEEGGVKHEQSQAASGRSL